MTAPVSRTSSEKIAMTTPVNQEKTGNQWRSLFSCLCIYIETLPQPLDPKVLLKEIPARRMAAITYSGTWSRKRYEEKSPPGTIHKKQGLKSIGSLYLQDTIRPLCPGL